ncbi:MAG TPA: Crp/Fnr family transcriptional regulator [Acidimicrobiales bacterium]|nr:Crp/Fnr family transcriptional regulator [Acidimicrobiales bacterium]
MKRLSHLGTRVPVRAGQRLTTAGNRGAEVLIVLSGTATCLVGESEKARFGPGDFFGEVATLDGGPRTATVVARTDMDVLVLNRFEFETLVKSSPDVAHRMLKEMAHRLRRANAVAVA